MKLVTIFLTCPNRVEADNVVKALFADKLAVCIKQSAVNSTFVWEDKIQSNEEVLLIIDTSEANFSKIEQAVKKIHSYAMPVLTAYPIVESSDGVQKWMKESLE